MYSLTYTARCRISPPSHPYAHPSFSNAQIGKYHAMTCLCRHRVEKGVQRQPINNLAREGGWWSAPLSGRFNPGKDPYQSYSRLAWLRGRSGRVQKISPSPRFDPRTMQPSSMNNICFLQLCSCPYTYYRLKSDRYRQ